MTLKEKLPKLLKDGLVITSKPGDEEKINVNVVFPGADCWIFAPTDTNMIKTRPILSAT